jgi:hypothetical protein
MSDSEFELFAKLLRLLGSSNAGERATAALKATEFLAARKLDWHDIVELIRRTAPRKPTLEETMQKAWDEAVKAQHTVSPEQTVHHTEAARLCLSLDGWTHREIDFLNDMIWVDEPTERQMSWLRSLYGRYWAEIKRQAG